MCSWRARALPSAFSWKYAGAPAAIGFLDSRAPGRKYDGSLFVGAANPVLREGYLMRFDLNRRREGLAFSDPRPADRVADNTAKYDPTESGTLIFGAGFGAGTGYPDRTERQPLRRLTQPGRDLPDSARRVGTTR